MEVVLGEVERVLRLADEGGDRTGDVGRLLAAVRQRPNVERLGGQRMLIAMPPRCSRETRRRMRRIILPA
jgi:hypothetical protein